MLSKTDLFIVRLKGYDALRHCFIQKLVSGVLIRFHLVCSRILQFANLKGAPIIVTLWMHQCLEVVIGKGSIEPHYKIGVGCCNIYGAC